jgi:hypothetical protein
MDSVLKDYASKIMYDLLKDFNTNKNGKPIRILLDRNLYNEYTKEHSAYTFNGVYISPINAPVAIAECNMPNKTVIKNIAVEYEVFDHYTKVTYIETLDKKV